MSPLYSPSALNKVWPRVVAIECFSKEKKKKRTMMVIFVILY